MSSYRVKPGDIEFLVTHAGLISSKEEAPGLLLIAAVVEACKLKGILTKEEAHMANRIQRELVRELQAHDDKEGSGR